MSLEISDGESSASLSTSSEQTSVDNCLSTVGPVGFHGITNGGGLGGSSSLGGSTVSLTVAFFVSLVTLTTGGSF